MKKKLLFIHIAKTGGASIRRLLNQSTPKIDYDCIHNGKLISFQDNKIVRKTISNNISIEDYDNTAYFVRNPYARLLSCYSYFHNGGLNQYHGSTHLGDLKIQEIIKEQFSSFRDCCHNLKDFCILVSHARPMSNCFLNIDVLPTKSQNVIHGRFESYDEDVVNLFLQLGLSLQSNDILKINKSSNKKDFIYNTSMKHEVYKYYKNDFDLFNYEK
jgi:hypothetical protein